MSKFLNLNTRDFVKGLLVAVLVAVFQLSATLLQNKGLSLTWNDLTPILDIALKSGSAYLLKNLLTNESGKFLGVVG